MNSAPWRLTEESVIPFVYQGLCNPSVQYLPYEVTGEYDGLDTWVRMLFISPFSLSAGNIPDPADFVLTLPDLSTHVPTAVIVDDNVLFSLQFEELSGSIGSCSLTYTRGTKFLTEVSTGNTMPAHTWSVTVENTGE